MIQEISNMIGVGITTIVGIAVLQIVHRETLRTTDFQAYLEQYDIPEQVDRANKYLRRGPMRIIIP